MSGSFYFRIFYLFMLLIASSLRVDAQKMYSLPVSGVYENYAIPDILSGIEEIHQIKIYYDPDKIPLYPVNVRLENVELLEALETILKGSNMAFTAYDESTIVITRYTKLNKENADRIVKAWQQGDFISPTSVRPKEIEIRLGTAAESMLESIEVTGRILDEGTREPIIGASLIGEHVSMASDVNGYFKFQLPVGSHLIKVDYIGYQSIELSLEAYESGRIELPMGVRTFQLTEVVVQAETAKVQLSSTSLGVEQLSPKLIKKLPSFMGEADIIKGLELLPGVSTVGEGAAGFNVRGGSIDQNLVLLDGGIVFNSAHALGIFSIFNPDAVRRVTLYKGHIPAQFGGRLSSVLDVEMKDGNFTKYKGQGGIGLASSRLAIEGPLLKNKISFVAAGRLSYSDWMLDLIEAPEVNKSSAKFRDFSLRLSYQISPNTSLNASAFSSFDFFRFAEDFGYSWETDHYKVELRHFLSEQLSINLKAIYGQYNSDFFDPTGSDAFDYSNGIAFYKATAETVYQINKDQSLIGGVNYIRYDSAPEVIQPRGEFSAIQPREIPQEQADEISAYINGDFKLTDRLSLAAGLRYTLYRQLGPGVAYEYLEGQPLNVETLIDSVQYQANELVQQYSGLEPRVSMNVKISETQSVKLSYNRLFQYIHLVSNTAAATPADVWQLSTPLIKPQEANNFSLGYYHNFKENTLISSIEVYYKQLRNIVTYKDFPELLLQDQIESEIVQAQGRAFGVELSLARTAGRWTGRVSYTFARSLIRTQSAFTEELVNNGAWFPADFDQPHRVTINAQWAMSPTTSMTFNFTFRSGRPISFPTEAYSIAGVVVPNFSPRNQFRIPAYHRLDWGINWDRSEAKRKGIRSSFTLSLYNLYGRRNPFSFFFRRNSRGVLQGYRLSVLGSAFPSLTYNFIF